MTEKVMAYKCESCGELSMEVGGSLYECGDCSTKFNRDNSADGVSHRCPDCNKFAGKIADQSCIECADGEVEEIEAWQDESGELFETEEEAAEDTQTTAQTHSVEPLQVGARVMFKDTPTSTQRNREVITLAMVVGAMCQVSMPHPDQVGETVKWWTTTKRLIRWQEYVPEPESDEARVSRDKRNQDFQSTLATLYKREA